MQEPGKLVKQYDPSAESSISILTPGPTETVPHGVFPEMTRLIFIGNDKQLAQGPFPQLMHLRPSFDRLNQLSADLFGANPISLPPMPFRLN
jgi:hypothetical protein